MAMAEVFIPNPRDSIPPLHTLSSVSAAAPPPPPPFPSPPPSTCSSYQEEQEQEQAQFLPPAPPPSPQGPVKVDPIFEIDASYFERPRKCEIPPSPTNSLDFSAMFTPNKSPLESEPHSPVQPSPGGGDFIDSAYCSAHASTSSQHSNVGSSQSIPISPSSTTAPAIRPGLFCSHSDDAAFRNGLRSQTSLSRHHPESSRGGPVCHLSVELASQAPRPRSHTHPSHTLTPQLSLLHEQHHQHHQEEILHQFHPHLPLSFDTTCLASSSSSSGAPPTTTSLSSSSSATTSRILDSGYHEILSTNPSRPRTKSNLKRKSNELGYGEGESMDLFSCDSFSESTFSGSDSDWFLGVQKPGNKKACQEGKNPIVRRQSSSFSGGFTYSVPVGHGQERFSSNTSAPSTPVHCNLHHVFGSFHQGGGGGSGHGQLDHQPSLSPPVFSSPQDTPFTPTPSGDIPTSLQSMELGEGGGGGGGGAPESLDSMMDTGGGGEQTIEMDSLSTQLRGSYLEQVSRGNQAPPPTFHNTAQNQTLGPPQISGGQFRSHSSGDSYYFGQNPQLATGATQVSDVFYFSYHETSENVLSEQNTAENHFLLSKSL